METTQYTRPWKVKTVMGSAGGHGDTSPAHVTLQVETQANTVEEVRARVEALPDLMEACKRMVKFACSTTKPYTSASIQGIIEELNQALVKAGGRL